MNINYYFKESNNYYCTGTCQGNFNKVVINKKIFIDDCKMMIIINMNTIILAIMNVQKGLFPMKLI